MTRIRKLLVANRGEIASRVIRSARALDIATVAVFSDADVQAPFVTEADESVALPGSTAAETYLRPELIIGAARRGAPAPTPCIPGTASCRRTPTSPRRAQPPG